ncbi:taurine ABC transporter substrate-binding protein [Cohnella sp. CIP 111063]|uniref:taurine ABC transporter substrate-binding protein n=1 Tax=unclassified Cohnella TaxID=2636738 RepID=UPI000B8BDDD7|nr:MULTISPECIES: aliphatic sulfonate ABC transporter substrate-binding protein [unclassified Cohnella]OXS52460.1 taurine ABC transporter substrate-binding protein [Cohnella sp. CIP 111063]PRX58512.1 taurine transport system substrate-binding protein [Cohnella sp. SGD-V74]
MSKWKKWPALAAGVLAIALVLGGCSSSSGGKLPKEVTIGYQIIPNAELLVKTKGLAEKQFPDTRINWKAFDSGRDVNTAIASGSIDLGLAGSVPVSIGVANKLPYKVYFLHDIIGDAESLAVRNESNIASVKDLQGKKVATPFGSTAHFSLLSALKLEGVDPKTVTILDLQPQDILAAWQRKDIDAAFVWNPVLAKLTAEGGSVVVSAQQLADQGAITADVGIVRAKFAEDYPEFVKQYVSVLDSAVQAYRDNPDDVAATLAPILSTDKDDALAQTKQLVWLTSAEQADAKYLGTEKDKSGFADVLRQTGEFLVEQKQIPAAPELSVYQEAILR